MIETIVVPDPPRAPATSSLLFEQYAERLRRGRTRGTQKNWAGISRRFDEWLRERGLTAETARMGDVEDYFDQLPLSLSSKRTHLNYIRAAYAYGARRGTIRDNPAIDVLLADPDPREPRIIPNDELRKIRAGIVEDRPWLFFHLLAYTGMRRAEIAGLRWDDGREDGSVLRLDQQLIRVVGKGSKLRYVPIHPALGECLAAVGPAPGEFVLPSYGHYGLAPETIQRLSRQLHPVYTPHDYRRTVATSLDVNGVAEAVRNRIMGWGARDIFQRNYRGVSDAELHRGILRLYADDPIS